MCIRDRHRFAVFWLTVESAGADPDDGRAPEEDACSSGHPGVSRHRGGTDKPLGTVWASHGVVGISKGRAVERAAAAYGEVGLKRCSPQRGRVQRDAASVLWFWLAAH